MAKEHFRCRFCKFETSNWKEAEEHFISKHKKSIKTKVNKQKRTNKTILIKKESRKEKTGVIYKSKKRNENEILMEQRITELRINATPTECFLKDKLNLFLKTPYIFQKGFYFNRQDFFFIVDFYFPEKNLVIEVDGEYHQIKEQKEKDILREEKLKKAYKLKILRYTNNQVYTEFFKILQDIKDVKEINTTPIQSMEYPKQGKKLIQYIGKKNIKQNKGKFKCDFCPMICKTTKRLQNHIKNSHNNNNKK